MQLNYVAFWDALLYPAESNDIFIVHPCGAILACPLTDASLYPSRVGLDVMPFDHTIPIHIT